MKKVAKSVMDALDAQKKHQAQKERKFARIAQASRDQQSRTLEKLLSREGDIICARLAVLIQEGDTFCHPHELHSELPKFLNDESPRSDGSSALRVWLKEKFDGRIRLMHTEGTHMETSPMYWVEW